MHNIVTIMRGLPGVGKSTLVREHCTEFGREVSADFYMTGPQGEYRFNPSRLGECHAKAQLFFAGILEAGFAACVDNTNCSWWEMAPYMALARAYKREVRIIDLRDGGLTDGELAARNKHGVPEAAIAMMRARYDTTAHVSDRYGLDLYCKSSALGVNVWRQRAFGST